MQASRPIIMDCDPGTDDALALLLASAALEGRIMCLLSSYGNTTLEHAHHNLRGLAALLGLDRAIYRGAAGPLGDASFCPTTYHGENGLCGIELPTPDDGAAGGIDEVAERICAAGRVVYVATGPLTNLALLLTRHPQVLSHMEKIVIMGGGIGFGNVPSGAEYNFSLDPQAVKAVLDCPVRKVLAPLNLTHTLAFSAAEVEEIVEAKAEQLRPASLQRRDVFGEILFRNLASALANGHSGAIIHDAATVAYLVKPHACAVEPLKLQCDGQGRIFEGADGQPVFVIREMDRLWLKELLRDAIRGANGDEP